MARIDPGAVAKITDLLARHEGNILRLGQFTTGIDDGTLKVDRRYSAP